MPLFCKDAITEAILDGLPVIVEALKTWTDAQIEIKDNSIRYYITPYFFWDTTPASGERAVVD
jgi:hypothetical protein